MSSAMHICCIISRKIVIRQNYQDDVMNVIFSQNRNLTTHVLEENYVSLLTGDRSAEGRSIEQGDYLCYNLYPEECS